MEHIWNNFPSTTNSLDKTITIPSDSGDDVDVETQDELEPKPDGDELVLQFESETNDRLRSFMQVCINCVNPDESDAI